ncbi:uncharacterized protein LOC132572205 [Heteronotia binoei]|uniref:uncharacterized protein LOC132572205 n=1 Tax=Heteronotia binoei TaxID=13085 RepID=UPI00293046FB|nr:uncharacterized protein LOC132572205 [Heteronotia binoei]
MQAGGAGAPWTPRETGDLISIWHEKLLGTFGASRRKIVVDGFQRIAEQMAVRGHRRSALECWTKIGALRVEYRRAFKHNAWRFRGPPRTCPFYAQLDRILHGDGIDKPLWITQSCKMRMVPAALPRNTGEARGSSSATSVLVETPVTETMTANTEEANKTVTEELLESAESPNRRECQNTPTPPMRNELEVVDSEVGVAQLSPASCLANTRTKRRCVCGPQSTAEHLVSPPSKQREEKPVGKGVRKSQRLTGRGARKQEELRSRSTAMKK